MINDWETGEETGEKTPEGQEMPFGQCMDIDGLEIGNMCTEIFV